MDWDDYWAKAQAGPRKGVYAVIAELYRNQIISRSAAHLLSRCLPSGPARRYLHAGCGSGGSDRRLTAAQSRFHCLDLSLRALALHRQQPLSVECVYVCGNIFALPYDRDVFDGIFNFGVMEHFSERDIGRILSEFHRVLKTDGALVLFWPPDFGLSVLALKIFLGTINRFRRAPLELHPPEISRIHSFRWVRDLMERHRFAVVHVEFGWRDLFTQVVVVAQKA
ncbi:MAG: hypothetical protein A3D28_01975 [Omnitrophica bacterium RIFCSPHIGHO2_02_FULL_63_14]|nr:MAG: hypothetical protein A3D28_01975 [Omnitrophica bacterium RIFCSPHIGHO2_02_FULL_63_14]